MPTKLVTLVGILTTTLTVLAPPAEAQSQSSGANLQMRQDADLIQNMFGPQTVQVPLKGDTSIKNNAELLSIHADQANVNFRIFLDGLADGKVVWTKEFPLNHQIYFVKGLKATLDGDIISMCHPALDKSTHRCAIDPIETQTFKWDGKNLICENDFVQFPLPDTGLPKNGADRLVVRGDFLCEGSPVNAWGGPLFLEGLKQGRTIWTKELPEDVEANLGKTDVDADQHHIYVSYEYPAKTIRMIQKIRVDGETLKLVDTKVEDPSSDAIALYKSIAVKGTRRDFEEAAKANKLEVMYPWNYIGASTIAEGIAQVHHKSLSEYHRKHLNEAIQRLELGLDCLESLAEGKCGKLEDKTRWLSVFASDELGMKPADYVPAVNDYGYFLQRAGRNQEAVAILRAVIKSDPNRTVAYLNLSDSLRALGKTGEARSYYQQYLALKRKQLNT